MAQRRDRVIALILAIVFFVTSVGVSGLVVWELLQKDDSSTINQEIDMASFLQGKPLEGFTPIEKVEQLQIIDLQEGTGKEVKAGDTITADYTGAVAATGIVFQSSLDSGQPFSTPLDGVIEGWQKGIPGMKEGGKRRIIIPAAQAYGETPPSGIPVNADLVFDVTLYSTAAE